MHYSAAVQHEGRRDKHGHLWTRLREQGPFCWRCDDCGRILHGVKAIWLDYECPVDKQVSCTERDSEPSIHPHEMAGPDYWEEWPEDGEPLSITSLHERLCRLERQRGEVLRLEEELEEAKARIAKLKNEWWLRHVDGGVWHTTTLEKWKRIEKEGAITVRSDGVYSKSWQRKHDYVCVWDFRNSANFDEGWASGGQSHIQAQTEPGTVWIEIDVDETIASEGYLNPRDYTQRTREVGVFCNFIPGCEGAVKHSVPKRHWVRVEMITNDRKWKTLRRRRSS